MRGLPAAEVHAALADQLAGLVPPDPTDPAAPAVLGANPADEAALASHGARDRLAAMLAGAFAQGAAGMVADIAGYCLQPWGFASAEVRDKTLLLYGARDPIAAQRHGSWWQRQLPDARLEMSPGAGHLLVMPTWRRALAHLAPARRGRA